MTLRMKHGMAQSMCAHQLGNCLAEMLHIVLPQRCVLCGGLVYESPWSPAPLCQRCESALATIVGPRCARCGRPLISEERLCMQCREMEHDTLKIMPIFMYRGAVATLVHRYKTDERLSLATYFALKLASLIYGFCAKEEIDPREVTIVPVPPRPEKLRSGKHDQVGQLAHLLNNSGFKVEHALKRRPHSVQQKTLARSERFKNASQSYSLGSPQLPQRVILLDDVVTTGATLRACADILTQAGAEVVAAAAIAAD